jgi:dihydroorotate dehydrogenase (NAD+) catalytic subunit
VEKLNEELGELGAVVSKGVTMAVRVGNQQPRVAETPAGMLNSIGLANVGVPAFLREKLPFLRDCGTRVIVNFIGETMDEYVRCAEALGAAPGIDALEMNISCPNVKAGGLEFGVDPEVAGRLVERVRAVSSPPLIVKLTPNVSDVVALARACVQGGAQALSLINTLRGMAIDARARQPRLARVFGGLSGPAIKPVALRMVYEVARAGLGVPVIGVGGITTGEDAAEFLLAGASLVQVGTASLVRPDAAIQVTEELAAFCREQGISQVSDLCGALGSGGTSRTNKEGGP